MPVPFVEPAGRIKTGKCPQVNVGEARLIAEFPGTFDEPERLPRNIQIFIASNQTWLKLSPDVRAMSALYDCNDVSPVCGVEQYCRLFDLPGNRPLAC